MGGVGSICLFVLVMLLILDDLLDFASIYIYIYLACVYVLMGAFGCDFNNNLFFSLYKSLYNSILYYIIHYY